MGEEGAPGSLPQVLAGLVLGVVLFTALANSQAEFAGNDVGLGLNTHSLVAFREERQIAGQPEDLADLRATMRELRRANRPTVLWLGASGTGSKNPKKNPNQRGVRQT